MFNNSPPTDSQMPLPIVRAVPNRPLEGVVCNRTYVGVFTHYHGGRTILHTNVESCVGCQENMEPRWQGYVIIESKRVKRFAVLQFTPMVGLALTRASAGTNGILGLKILVSRLGNRINSPLACKIAGYDAEATEFPVYRLENIVRSLFGEKLVKRAD